MTEENQSDKGPLPRRIGVGVLVGAAAAVGAFLVSGEVKESVVAGLAFFFIAFLNGAKKPEKN